MLGGVMLAAMGLAVHAGRGFFGAPVPTRIVDGLRRRGITGALVYWASAVAAAIAEGRSVQVGPSSSGRLIGEVAGPAGMAVGAGLLFSGVVPLFRHAVASTVDYRAAGWAQFRARIDRYNGAPPTVRGRIPNRRILVAEVAGAGAGFPGLGWIFSGSGAIGLPLALVGPAIAWGVMPLLINPGTGLLDGRGSGAVVAYLLASTMLSAVLLSRRLRLLAASGTGHGRSATVDPPTPAVVRVRRGAGAFFVGSVFVAIVAIPIAAGITAAGTNTRPPPMQARVPLQNDGTYLVTSAGVIQLYRWVEPSGETPPGSPAVASQSLHNITVVGDDQDSIERFVLYDLARDRAVDWSATSITAQTIELRVPTLPPSRYVLLAPSPSRFGGSNYFHFEVTR
jgi:hypothetical protein